MNRDKLQKDLNRAMLKMNAQRLKVIDNCVAAFLSEKGFTIEDLKTHGEIIRNSTTGEEVFKCHGIEILRIKTRYEESRIFLDWESNFFSGLDFESINSEVQP